MPIEIVRPHERRLEHDPKHRDARIQRFSAADPYVHVLEFAAGASVEPHTHTAPELMIVLEGSIIVADVECGAGSLIRIPADEEYGFSVGAERTILAVVRPTHGTIHTTSSAALDG